MDARERLDEVLADVEVWADRRSDGWPTSHFGRIADELRLVMEELGGVSSAEGGRSESGPERSAVVLGHCFEPVSIDTPVQLGSRLSVDTFRVSDSSVFKHGDLVESVKGGRSYGEILLVTSVDNSRDRLQAQRIFGTGYPWSVQDFRLRVVDVDRLPVETRLKILESRIADLSGLR